MAGTLMMVDYRDLTGEGAVSLFHMAAGADPTAQAALLAALDGISDAGISKLRALYQDTSVIGTTEAGVYDDAADKLVLEFQGANGGKYTYEIPAPLDDCFTADTESIDLTFCQTSITAIITNCVDSGGGALTFVNGYRSRRTRKS